MRHRPVVAYVVLAYALSWAYWVPMAVAELSGVERPWSSHVPGLVGPALAAFVVTWLAERGAGVRRLLGSIVRLRLDRWLIVAVSPMLVMAMVTVAVAPFAGWPSWSDFGVFDGLPAAGPIGVLVLLVVVNGVGEEVGWRGFLQPRLQQGRSIRNATLGVAAIWAAWHTPIFFLDTSLGAMSVFMVPGWLIGLTAGAVVLAWLHNHSGSVLLVALWHGTYNWVAATAGGDGAAGIAVTALVIVAAIVLVRRDPTLGARPPEPQP